MSNLNGNFDVNKLHIRQEVAKLRGTYQILLSPDLAEKWLTSFNTSNRPLSEKTAREYADRMKNGQWVLNGETIKFSTDGRMIDGQHRCRAVVISNECVEVELRFGLKPNVFDTIDEGKKRTGRDVLAIDGIPNYSIAAAAITSIIVHDRDKKAIDSTYTSVGNRPSNKDIRGWYYEHPEIAEIVLLALKWYSLSVRILSPSKFAAWCYLFSQKDRFLAEKFLTDLATGANLSPSSPVFLLRMKLMQSRFDRQKKLSPVVEKAIIIKAWNYTRQGKSIKLLKFDTVNEQFPEII